MMDVFMRYPGGKDKALTFSYDDGLLSDIRLAGIFDKYSMKCTFNHCAGMYTKEDVPNENRVGHKWMKLSEVKANFANSPHEIAIHGYTHPFYDLLPVGNTVCDIVKDREILEKEFGRIIRGFAFPNGAILNSESGSYDENMTSVLKNCGIAYARTTRSTNNFYLPSDWYRWLPTCHHNSPELMRLAKLFAESRVDRIARLFYVWGHSFEFDKNDNWNVIEELAAYLGERDDIWFASNIEIFDYINAYKRLVFSIDGTRVYNPNACMVYFNKNGKDYSVFPNETVAI